MVIPFVRQEKNRILSIKMTENKYSLNISSSEDDDEFVCEMCKVIVYQNDKKYALSECFNKCHFFCPPCIKSSVITDGSKYSQTELSCPLCMLSERENEVKEQLWCSQCNVPASLACYEESHIIQNYNDLYNAHSLQLKLQINQTNSACDHTLIKCRQIQSVHQVILTWMQWLHLEISQWDSANNATVAQLESLKISEGFHVPQEKDLQCSIDKINQLIAQFNDRFKEAQASQLKVIQLFQTYSECTTQQELTPSAQTSNAESTELMKWFSTSFNQTNQSCINVLAFLISLLRKGDKKIKEEEQDSNDARGKATIRLKRRSEEDQESSRVGKKARNESSDRFEKDLSCDFSRNNADSLAVKKEKELHYPEENENHAEQTFSNQVFEDRAAELGKEAERNTDVPNRIARLEADLEFMTKQIKQVKESEAKARKETLNQIERAKRIEEKYEMELKQHSSDVKQLKAAREQLAQSRSQLATVLRELSSRTSPDLIEKVKRDKELLEKRLEQVQAEMDEIKETREKSTIHVMRVNAESVTVQIRLQEEVRLAKEESQQLKTKLAETMAKHISELHRFRNYKTQFEELKIEFDKLILEKEKCSANLAAVQAAQIKDQEIAKNKAELEKANPKIVKQEMYHPCLSSTKQQIVPVVANQQHPAAQHVTSTFTPQQIIQQNPTKEHNVQNVVFPNVMKPNKHLQIFNFNAIASDMLAELHNNNRDFDQFLYPCNNCKWPVETGFYCGECEDFKLCFLCHKKDGHYHKMEKFGFELDRMKSSSHSKDVTEDRKSRIDRRVLSFVHSFYCSIGNCLEPFCRTMKEVVAHNLACHAKTSIGEVKGSPKLQTRCLVCRQLVGLIISHAKHCTDPECSKPHCSNVKKKIKNALFQNNLLKSTKKVFPPPKKQGNPNLEPLGSRNIKPIPINATTTSSADLSKIDLSKKQLPDNSPADNFPLAVHSVIQAPTSSGSVDSGIEKPSPTAITYAENLKRVQDNVALIIHAHKCLQGVNQANETCPTPYCLKMKNVLNHVRSCQNGESCQVPHCSHSKKIISHWRNCCRSDCPFCVALKASDHNNVTVDSHSSGVGALALTVKPYEALGENQAPTKSAGQLPRLQPAPFQQLNSIAQMKNVGPVTSTGNVSHVARQIQDEGDNERAGEDAAKTPNSMRVLPKLQEMGKRFVKPLQLNVLLTTRVLHPPPINNLLTSQNVTVDGGTQVNQAIHPVGAKTNVDTSTSADGEKRKIPQKLVDSIPQQPLSGKTMHLGLAIAMGGGICCPVGAMNRKALTKLLLDPKPFGCRFRSTLKELLMKMKSPNVTEESRQRIAIFFGINYLFVCSFFRKQSEQSGL